MGKFNSQRVYALRARAHEVRAIADHTNDRDARAQMLRIAESYDRMADLFASDQRPTPETWKN